MLVFMSKTAYFNIWPSKFFW